MPCIATLSSGTPRNLSRFHMTGWRVAYPSMSKAALLLSIPQLLSPSHPEPAAAPVSAAVTPRMQNKPTHPTTVNCWILRNFPCAPNWAGTTTSRAEQVALFGLPLLQGHPCRKPVVVGDEVMARPLPRSFPAKATHGCHQNRSTSISSDDEQPQLLLLLQSRILQA